MAKLLVLFSTSEGQTARIAYWMARRLRQAGHQAVVHDIAHMPHQPLLDQYDGVIVGASIHGAHHARNITRFVKDHGSQLNSIPSAFFSVSLSAAGDLGQQDDALACLERFLDETGWTPELSATFAGALPYSKYGPFKRWLMKRIMARAHGDTDSSYDYEYTDWNQVDQFVEDYRVHLGNLHAAPEYSI